jgi:hypothetical protein
MWSLCVVLDNPATKNLVRTHQLDWGQEVDLRVFNWGASKGESIKGHIHISQCDTVQVEQLTVPIEACCALQEDVLQHSSRCEGDPAE